MKKIIKFNINYLLITALSIILFSSAPAYSQLIETVVALTGNVTNAITKKPVAGYSIGQ